jgi:hypothetical protein
VRKKERETLVMAKVEQEKLQEANSSSNKTLTTLHTMK